MDRYYHRQVVSDESVHWVMPARFKSSFKEVALWADVVEAMDGKPYRLVSIAGIRSGKIHEASIKGYFGEALTWRILKATANRVKTTDYASIQSNNK